MNYLYANLNNYSNNTGFEFSKFMNCKRIDDSNYLWTLKKKEVLDEIERYYILLPKVDDALKKKSNLSINSGIKIKDENEDNPSNQKLLEEFFDSFPNANPDEFLQDVVRIDSTKSTQAIILIENPITKIKQWTIVEPNRLGLISPSKNSINAKHSLKTVRVFTEKNTWTDFDLNNDKSIILFRRSPASIFAVPKFMFAQAVSKSIIAEIYKHYLNSRNGGFDKTVVTPKENEQLDVSNTKSAFEDVINSPDQNVIITNKKLDLQVLKALQSDPSFWTNLTEKYASHIASLTEVGVSYLMPPATINRVTKEMDYKEMIQDSIQPLNNRLTKLVNNMFKKWLFFNKKSANFALTVENPKHKLDIELSVSDLIDLENSGVITTNELRKELGLEEFDDEQLAIRDEKRKIVRTQTK